MKHFLLLCICLLLGSAALWAQEEPACIPDQNIPDGEPIYPIPHVGDGLATDTSGINRPACIGESYAFTLTLKTPATFQQGENELPLANITLAQEGAIKVVPPGGLPSTSPPLANGLDYRCFPTNCIFLKDSLGCILIEGTPDFDGVDTLNLGIQVTLNIQTGPNNTVPINFSFPNSEFPGNYFLEVRNEGECDEIVSTRDPRRSIDFSIWPNPAREQAQLRVSTEEAGRFQLRVFDVLGRIVSQQPVELFQGENQIPLNISDLSRGVYLVNLNQGTRSATRRMVVGQ